MARFLTALADAAPLGGKAGRLAQLIAAGLPVPDGVVLGPDAFAAVAGPGGEIALDEVGHRLGHVVRAIDDAAAPPPGLAEVLDEVGARLAPLAVRSSMSLEDGAARAAPGVFVSSVDVPARDAWDAVRAVWRAALAPLAVAYAHGAPIGVAVILQRFVRGARATVYTRPPGHPARDEVWIERDGEPLRRVSRGDDERVVALALAAERAIGASDGADVEAVIAGEAIWLVQARPIVHPVAAAAKLPAPEALLRFSSETPGVRWRRDVEHNPDPLSPAQAGLVDAVVAAGASSGRLHVAAGYLFYAVEAPSTRASPALGAARNERWLRERFDDMAARMRAPLDAVAEDASVAAAVDAYVAAYRVFAHEISPLVSAARAHRSIDAPRPASALDAALLAAARGELDDAALLARVGDFAPAWDVAVPTFAEQPQLVRDAVIRLRALAPPRRTPGGDAIAAVAAAIAEEDDALFARAQAIVRRALLRAGARAGLDDPEDACWLPLRDADAIADPIKARAQAAAARRAAERARAWELPLELVDGVATPALASDGDHWTGVAGSGGRVTGAIHRLDDLARAASLPPGAIVLAATVTPALALALTGARGLITAHGGALDHGAAMARELGLPSVIGCRGAWASLRDGELVELDGDAGSVRRLA